MQRKISQFLASAAPVAITCAAGLLAATPALADTTVSTGTTETLNTSAAGNVTVSGTGTLTAPTGATTGVPAITIDSSNTATINGGGIVYAGVATAAQDNAIGIKINTGVTTTVTNVGAIYALENYTPSGISGAYLNGNVSGVSGRYGIYGAAGGTINGTITNSGATTVGTNTYTGTIAIDGENSAGIEIDSVLNGSLVTEGNITVLGDNSYGVKLGQVTANTATNSAATGNVTIGGVVTVTGSGAQGYVQTGDVAGIILIDGSISNSTTYTDTNGTSLVLSKSLINSGAGTSPGSSPIVEIDGNVAGGILINAPTTSTSSDTNRGSITAYGNNPALQIGGTTDITIGANANTDNGSLNANTNTGSFALGIDGAVSAIATSNSGTSAYGVVIGGRGGNVTLTGGLEVYGTVSASTFDTAATGILIQSGSNVSTIFNSGTIKASASDETSGNVYAIQDLSGTVKSLTNQGYITVSASPQAGATVAAIDLSHSIGTTAAPITLTQSYTVTNQTNETNDQAATGYNPLTETLYAGISGNVLFGTGVNVMTIASGGVSGDTYFGGGSTNTITVGDVARWGSVGLPSNIYVGTAAVPGTLSMTLNNYAQFVGTLNLYNGTGTSTLTLNNSSSFLGTISDGASLDVTVNGGTFGANAVGSSTVRNLTVASGAALNVYVDGAGNSSQLTVANTASFASGSKIQVTVGSLSNIGTPTAYDVLTAGTLKGASNLTTSSLNLPVLYSASVSSTATDLIVTLGRATAAQLGLTSAQSAAYNAIINDATANVYIQDTLLAIYDTSTLKSRFNELLPNYAGGTFDLVTRATRLADKHFQDDSTMFSISDSSAWIEPIVFEGTRTFGDTPGFKNTGFGLSMGYEKVTPVGNVGFQFAWVTGNSNTTTYDYSQYSTSQKVKVGEFEFGLFWRKSAGPFYVWAGGNLGRETFDSTRTFFEQYENVSGSSSAVVDSSYNAGGHWAGWSGTFNGGASYTVGLGDHWNLRPRGVIEYDRLQENSYIESGDTPIALTVGGRVDTQTTASGTLLAQWTSGPGSHEGRPFSVELEAGRRQWLTGNLGTTTATFETGDQFSINGGHLPSAWVSNLSIVQGGLDYTWRIGTDIERGTDKGVAYGVRASIAIAL